MNAQLILTGDLSEITQALSSLNGSNVQVSTSISPKAIADDEPVKAEKPAKSKASKPAAEPEPVNTASEDFNDGETPEAAPEVTLTFLKQCLGPITGDAKKKAEIKAIMSEFGADGLSKLASTDYGKFYNRIKALL